MAPRQVVMLSSINIAGCDPPGKDFAPEVKATRMCARIDDDQQAAPMQRYG